MADIPQSIDFLDQGVIFRLSRLILNVRNLLLKAFTVVVCTSLTGCSYTYLLKGHNARNCEQPPDITMMVGEVRDVLREPAVSRKDPIPPDQALSLSSRGVVLATKDDGPTKLIYLRGCNAGQVRIRYFGKGEGFLVTVMDRRNPTQNTASP